MKAFFRQIVRLGGLAAAMIAAPAAWSQSGLPPSEALSIDNVAVVDARSGAVRPGMTVEMLGGKITRVVPTIVAYPRLPGRRVDATGKFVVPGYVNMHSHGLGPRDPSGALALMLAEGVTGFRQMSASTELLLEKRLGRLPLGLYTPSLITMGSEVLSPFNAGSPTASAIMIASSKAQGAEFIKIGVVSPETFYAVLAQARENGLPAVGHLQNGVDAARAAREGMRSIEHLGPGEAIWIACSRDKDALLIESAQHPAFPDLHLPVPVPGADQAVMELYLKKRLINPAAYNSPEDVARLQRAFDSYDDQRCRALVSDFVTYQTWHVPTLVRLRTQYLADDPAYQTDPFLQYMPPENIQAWQDTVTTFKQLPPQMLATYRQAYARQMALTKLLSDMGVPLLTGVDDGDLQLPGLTLQQEFAELAKAGLQPLKILQMATVNAAAALGRTDRMGQVAGGFDADLVLLDANPIQSAANLGRIAGVVRSGYYQSAQDLSALKARVAAGHGYLQ